MNLKNKTAIVTGGTKGIGRAIAEALLREGVSVCISARISSEIDDAVKSLTSLGQVIGFKVDVRVYEQVKALIDHTVNKLSGLDILINNLALASSRRSSKPRRKISAPCSKRISSASSIAVTRRFLK